ncbi:MAG TPA: ATP-binding protein [Acidimicrobiia bacterium]|nr:ATP-binding protein [Acidimicrobiia bacterium]HZQ76358.1 ATP-binding protein [Acidimicrobiia bacterium]
MDGVVELEIPARPEYVGIARMAVGALAGIRPGLPYERIDDLRIVVSEACTSAIEVLGMEGCLRLRCVDSPKVLEIRIEAPGAAFESVFPDDDEAGPEVDSFRISLIRALVDDAELRSAGGTTELCLVVHRDGASDEDDGDLPA